MNQCKHSLLALMTLALLFVGVGCSDRNPTDLDVARARIDPLVFGDGPLGDPYFQPFSGTYTYAVTLDSLYAHNGSRSLRVTVPPQDSPLGGYAGGVLTTVAGRDLADFNALTFWARSSVPSSLNVAGFGNDNTGNSLYEAGRSRGIPLTTDWTFVVVPIPAPSKLISERGLFTFAEGWETLNPQGHELWFDEIRFAHLDNITDPVSTLPSAVKHYFVGATASLSGTFTRFKVDGAWVIVDHMPGYFDFVSSDPAVAVVERGAARIVGTGNAVVTATREGEAVGGTVTLSGYAPPSAAAPAPAFPAADVISLYSDAYADVPVDSWNPHWGGSSTEDAEYAVAGNDTRMYSNLNFVGIDFLSRTVDISGMTHLHLDVYAPSGTLFRVKLVAFDGDNGALIDQKELPFDDTSTPAFAAGGWSVLDIPLADFQLVEGADRIGQLVLSTTDAKLVLVDNILWHR